MNNAFVDAGLLVDARRPLKVTIFNGYHSQLAVDTSPQLHCTVINTTHRKPRSRANRRQPFSYSAILASTALQDITAPLLPTNITYKHEHDCEFSRNMTASPDRRPRDCGAVSVDLGSWQVDEIQICQMGSHGAEGEYISCGGCALVNRTV